MNIETCPECGGPSAARCRCPLEDRVCHNGHEWHVCPVHGCIVRGGADHAIDTFACRCPRAKFREGDIVQFGTTLSGLRSLAPMRGIVAAVGEDHLVVKFIGLNAMDSVAFHDAMIVTGGATA